MDLVPSQAFRYRRSCPGKQETLIEEITITLYSNQIQHISIEYFRSHLRPMNFIHRYTSNQLHIIIRPLISLASINRSMYTQSDLYSPEGTTTLTGRFFSLRTVGRKHKRSKAIWLIYMIVVSATAASANGSLPKAKPVAVRRAPNASVSAG